MHKIIPQLKKFGDLRNASCGQSKFFDIFRRWQFAAIAEFYKIEDCMPRSRMDHWLKVLQDDSTSSPIDDERIEQADELRQAQIRSALAALALSSAEKQFVVCTAEKVGDLICDDFVDARSARDIDQHCICAAAIIALMIVYDC